MCAVIKIVCEFWFKLCLKSDPAAVLEKTLFAVTFAEQV